MGKNLDPNIPREKPVYGNGNKYILFLDFSSVNTTFNELSKLYSEFYENYAYNDVELVIE